MYSEFKIKDLLACFNPETKELLDTAIVINILYKYSDKAYAKTAYSAYPPEIEYDLHFTKENYYRSGVYSEMTINNVRFMLLKEYEEKYGRQRQTS